MGIYECVDSSIILDDENQEDELEVGKDWGNSLTNRCGKFTFFKSLLFDSPIFNSTRRFFR